MLIHPQIDPIALQLGPVAVHWYGLTYLAAFALFMFLGSRRLRHAPFNALTGPQAWTFKDVEDILFLGVVGVVLGGRIGYCLFYKPGYYATHPLEVFYVWQGGMSFHGGMLGVIASMAWFARSRAKPFWQVADFVAPCVATGLAAGRVGNFINGELWGRETTVPWAIRFCNDRILSTYGICPAGDVPRHPSQLYEAGLEGLLLFGLLSLAIWKFRLLAKPGYVTGLFLVGYGLSRIALENVRQPDVGLDNLPLGLTMGILLSVPMIAIGGWLIWRAWKTAPVAEPEADPTAT